MRFNAMTTKYLELSKNWHINHRHNQLLFKYLTPDLLQLKSRPRGRTIEAIFRHLVQNKQTWLPHLSPIPDIEPPSAETGLEVLENSSFNYVIKLIELADAGTPIKGFPSGLFGFVIYLISHDSHHRGQILQIIRDHNINLDKDLQYGIWNWKV